MNKPISRAEAVVLIKQQLKGLIKVKSLGEFEMSKGSMHYGKADLRVLLDAIYGGPPTKEEEL